MTTGSVLSSRYSRNSVFRCLLRHIPACGLLFLLAACAGQQQKEPSGPAVPAEEAAAQYRAHARSYYAAPGPADDPWGPYIHEASSRFDVPEIWIRAVIHQESGGRLFQNGQLITSGPGAMGLMQLMPLTYDEMRYAYNLSDDPYEPHDNIMAGTAYIRQMYDTYGTPGFLAAYNAGPGRLEDFLAHNRTLPRETRNYVASIGRRIVGVFPSNRSQADMLVSSHDTMAQQYKPVQSAGETQSVSSVWASRMAKEQPQSQSQPQLNTPPLGRVSRSEQAAQAESVSSAWASRMAAEQPQPQPQAQPQLQPQLKSQPQAKVSRSEQAAQAESVSSAWASRMAAEKQAAQSAPQSAPQSASLNDEEEDDDRPQSVTTTQKPDVKPVPSSGAQSEAVSLNDVNAIWTKEHAGKGEETSSDDEQQQAVTVNTPLSVESSSQIAGQGNWAIQVGAFTSMAQARQSVRGARARARKPLNSAMPQIAQVAGRKGRLYRARLTNLSQNQAVTACGILRGQCIVVAPSY